MSEPRGVDIGSADLRVSVLPEIGARLHALRVLGHDLLRTPADRAAHAADPIFWGAFVMAPWCNRLTPGPLEVAGQLVDLRPNFHDGTAIHGQVFAAAWQQTGDAAFEILSGGDGWPWRYRVEQQLAVDGLTLRITQRLTSLSESPMPAGLGLHPWFVNEPRVAINAGHVIASASDPAAVAQPVSGELDMRHERQMAAGIDATWVADGDPVAELHWPALGLRARMRSSPRAPHVVAANPPEIEALAVEPQTHAPYGLRRLLNGEPGGLELIDAGQALEHVIELEFSHDED